VWLQLLSGQINKVLNNNQLKLKVMQQILKQMQTHANSSVAMETGDHFKNGAIPKSLTSRGNIK
jgi:hypothetical protein